LTEQAKEIGLFGTETKIENILKFKNKKMEVLVSHVIETRKDGSKIVRNFFFNEEKTNWLVKAQSYFTKDEKKQAKLNHKNN